MKKLLLTTLIIFIANCQLVVAQGPNNSGTYYQKADMMKGQALKSSLGDIIYNHKELSYSFLWQYFKSTDIRSDGKIWDMYSNATNYVPGSSSQGANYSKEGDSYNREHSFPKSWFNDSSPMVTDLTHIVPTDGYVNGRRGNSPFGETNGEIYKSSGGFSKLGKSTINGYTGTVFEPNDEYKGDFARIYFYMVTCYENKITSWSSDMLSNNTYPAFKQWALSMLLQWAKMDPVSQKEINRNNTVGKIQGNRNPFIDYPGLEQYIWGSYVDSIFSYNNYKNVTEDTTTPISKNFTFNKVTSSNDLVTSASYIIVCESENKALSASSDKTHICTNVAINNNLISTECSQQKAHTIILTAINGAYTLFDSTENNFLSLSGDDDYLNTSSTAENDNTKWYININSSGTSIINKEYPTREIRFNTNIFACFNSSTDTKAITLYINKTSTGIKINEINTANAVNVYTIEGRLVRLKVNVDDALNNLPNGIYIINGKKIIKNTVR